MQFSFVIITFSDGFCISDPFSCLALPGRETALHNRALSGKFDCFSYILFARFHEIVFISSLSFAFSFAA